ncbi:hypothetical protein PRUPE_8G226300 [Prunus persica]|uniref:Uncharacterized protein n=1 Tax=Prunus persica TaxID=3760 RepID=A0A251N1W3_PRUPE|nr:hypothetical protein PRUPE_8G226300 [Prunus persica]
MEPSYAFRHVLHYSKWNSMVNYLKETPRRTCISNGIDHLYSPVIALVKPFEIDDRDFNSISAVGLRS